MSDIRKVISEMRSVRTSVSVRDWADRIEAALNARAGDARDAERWRALRARTWHVHEIEPSEFDEHGDEAIAALASQAGGVKDGR